MPICAERPLAGNASVIERRLAHEVDLDPAVDAFGGAHKHVLGVLVGRRPGVRCDRILPTARPHRQGVAHDHPAGGRLPRGHERVGPRLIDPAGGDVDPERAEPEPARAAVEQRAEHAGRVEARDAQPVDRAVGSHERARMAIGEEGVVGDRRERRPRRRALRRRSARAQRTFGAGTIGRSPRHPLGTCGAHPASFRRGRRCGASAKSDDLSSRVLRDSAAPAAARPDVTDAQFRTLGLVEVLGAIGLILPVRSRRRCAWINRLAPAILLLALALHRDRALLRCGATTVRRCRMSTLVMPLALWSRRCGRDRGGRGRAGRARL